jgi:molecular chaperone GrpE
VTHDPHPPAPSVEPDGSADGAAESAEGSAASSHAADAGAPTTDAGEPAAVAADPTADAGEPAADAVDPLPGLEGEGPYTELFAAALADPRSRAELFADYLEAEAKRDEYLDDLRRSHAELENYRKRVLRDAALQRDHGRMDVVNALLESLDDLDRTEAAGADSSDEALAKGIGLVAAKLRDALASIGVERIDTVGVAFDPNVHEAVQQVPADEPHDEPQVAQVLRSGYRLGDRTLRAAMVVVSQ